MIHIKLIWTSIVDDNKRLRFYELWLIDGKFVTYNQGVAGGGLIEAMSKVCPEKILFEEVHVEVDDFNQELVKLEQTPYVPY